MGDDAVVVVVGAGGESSQESTLYGFGVVPVPHTNVQPGPLEGFRSTVKVTSESTAGTEGVERDRRPGDMDRAPERIRRRRRGRVSPETLPLTLPSPVAVQ